MSNNNVPVSVNVNFHNVAYDATTQTWSGIPIWTIVPNSSQVPPVKPPNTNTIQWNLNAAAVPALFDAQFIQTGAIEFYGANTWPGSNPTRQDDTHYICEDNFNGLLQNIQYDYRVTVTLVGTGQLQGVSKTFTTDPDVENESGTVMAALPTAG